MDNVSSYRLSQTVTAAGTYDITQLTTWKDDYNVTTDTDDAFIGRTITRCSRIAANYCNRDFGAATYQDTFRLERGCRSGGAVDGGRNPLMLKVFPLIAVTSVTLIAPDGTTIALSQGTDFEINPDTGMIYRLDDIYQQPRDWSPMQTVVVYQAGYLLPNQTASNYPATAQTVPDDLEDAVGRMIYSRYVERSRDPFLKRVEDPRVGVKEYWIGGTPGQDGALTDDIREILDKYRVPMVG